MFAEIVYRLFYRWKLSKHIDHFNQRSASDSDTELCCPHKPTVIVCAAVNIDGLIIASPRHYDAIGVCIQELIIPEFIRRHLVKTNRIENGFVDQRTRFYTRSEAFELAKNNGQISSNGHGILMSEMLY